MNGKKIAILGTRGIPNQYGGFEQFAQHLAVGLLDFGYEVYVYSPHNHIHKATTWKNVNIIHCFDPEYRIGSAGQFVYDLNCILDSRKRNFDIILQLGYTSSSVWSFLFPRGSKIVTNMDGLEWKRSKYSATTKLFLRYAENLAVKKSDYLVADSDAIKTYLREKFGVFSTFIAYGADLFRNANSQVIDRYGLRPYSYDMLIARLEPENNIEMIIDGFVQSKTDRQFIVVANFNTKYGRRLVTKYQKHPEVRFLGPVYEMDLVNNLRYFSNLYFHGHSVGGTNPSLLEAMASGALIAAHKNPFNASVLGEEAYYFANAGEVCKIVNSVIKNESETAKIEGNENRIRDTYSWEKIIEAYRQFFSEILGA